MLRKLNPGLIFFVVVMISLVTGPENGRAQNEGMKGWEKGSPYNQLFNPAEMDSFRATIIKITEETPIKGMAPGVVLHVRESEKETIVVHVCPAAYKGANDISMKRGDRIKINGVWAEIDGEDVFMASKIKRGDFFVLKVRLTKDGTPFWTMSPEELAREKEEVGSN